MLFVELAHAIHPYLMKDGDVPSFMRDLIQRICDIPEDEWYTKKDPSSDEKYKDGSLRKFYTRGLTKKLAKNMLGRLTRQNFIDSLNHDDYATDVSEVNRQSLAKAIEPFTYVAVDEDNVADVLFDLLKLAIEYTVNSELEKDRELKKATTFSNKAKIKYGPKLLEDCKHTCSKPDCGNNLLTVTSDNQSTDDFEIIKILGHENTYNNLLAFCHDCFNSYVLKHTKSDERELKKIKALQSQTNDARQILKTVDIEYGIRKVIENLKRAKQSDFESLNYTPVFVEQKIESQSNYFLYTEVINNVTKFYKFIDDAMKEAVKAKCFDDDLLRAQIKASYRRLEDKKIPKELIYQSLAERLNQITKQDIRYCYIVISYFIQSCEVFNATT